MMKFQKNNSKDSTMMCSSFLIEGCDNNDRLYQDYLNVPYEIIKKVLIDPYIKRKHGPRGGVSKPFPVRLYEMLSIVNEEQLDHIVSWQSHGRCFILHNPKAFVSDIMPRFFKQTKLTSFRRQLNLYGFKNVTSGRDNRAHYHPLFLRGRPDLCRIMIRIAVKSDSSSNAFIYPPSLTNNNNNNNNTNNTTVDDYTSTTKSSFYALPSCPPAGNIENESVPILQDGCSLGGDDAVVNMIGDNNIADDEESVVESICSSFKPPSIQSNNNNNCIDDPLLDISSSDEIVFTNPIYYKNWQRSSPFLGPLKVVRPLERSPILPTLSNNSKYSFQQTLMQEETKLQASGTNYCAEIGNDPVESNNNSKSKILNSLQDIDSNIDNCDGDGNMLEAIFEDLPFQLMDQEDGGDYLDLEQESSFLIEC